jgi:P27 family predicted phage terminase small subunit
VPASFAAADELALDEVAEPELVPDRRYERRDGDGGDHGQRHGYVFAPAARTYDVKGRPPKSREQRIAEGNPGRRALPEPVLGLGKMLEFPPPAELSQAERAAWDRFVPEVARLGWIDAADREVLEQLVHAIALADELRAAVRRDGIMVPTYDKDGIHTGDKVHPAVRAHAQQQTIIVRIAEQFGLTPSARARLGLTVAKGAGAAAALAAILDGDDDDGVIEVPDSGDAATES